MNDSTSTQQAETQPARSTGYSKGPKALVPILWFVALPAAILLLVWGAPKALNGTRWALAELNDRFGWFPLVVFALLAAGLLIQAIWRLRESKQAADAKPVSWQRAFAPCFTTIALGAVFNGCLNIASNQVDTYFQDRKPHTLAIYQNHDLAKLSGQCIRLAMLRHAGGMSNGPERKALESLADDAPQEWQKLATADDPLVRELGDAKLTQFIQEPKAKALNQERWRELLAKWRTAADATALSDATLNAAAQTIGEDFGITLREALKADFEKGGKAWAAMQLDIAQRLLNHTPVSLATGNDQINAALAEVKGLLADEAKGLPALHRTILDARQVQDEHARAVTRNFDQVVGMLQRIQVDVTVIKADVAETKGDVKEIKTDVKTVRGDIQSVHTDVKQVQADVGKLVTIEQFNDAIRALKDAKDADPKKTQAKAEALLDQKQALQVPGEPAATVPADVQAAVKDLFKNAPKVVRFAALARVGLDKEADELAAEIERNTAGLSEADQYQYYVAKGDRYWNSNDFWNAATWYAQAMAISIIDPAIVDRAARSRVLSPRQSMYVQDIQLAQSWVERCLAKIETKPSLSLDTTRLHVTLAALLVESNKTKEAVAVLRTSLQLLDAARPKPVSTEVSDAAIEDVLDGRFATTAVVTSASHAYDDEFYAASRAEILASIARVFISCGDSLAAEQVADAGVAETFANGRVQSARAAIAATVRSEVRRVRENLDGADSDIRETIEWELSSRQPDQHRLAIRYAIRARIREDQAIKMRKAGDSKSADALFHQSMSDISAALRWFEVNLAGDARRLASYREDHARIEKAIKGE